MKVEKTNLEGVLLITPDIFSDERGSFRETWNFARYSEFGIESQFVQDNHSTSVRGVLRGLHYQVRYAQGKLVRVTRGEVYDVAVDLRKSSAQFGTWTSSILSAENKRQLWIPPGFAHGFLVLSDEAEFQYKCTDYYAPDYERTLLWNDPELGIRWPLDESQEPGISAKDRKGTRFCDAEVFP